MTLGSSVLGVLELDSHAGGPQGLFAAMDRAVSDGPAMMLAAVLPFISNYIFAITFTLSEYRVGIVTALLQIPK